MSHRLQNFSRAFTIENPHTNLLWHNNPEQVSTTLSAYTNLWHSDHHDGRETDRLYGVVGGTPELLTQAQAVNDAKVQFQAAIKAINQKSRPSIVELLHAIEHPLREMLSYHGLGRLHLKQCYRQIPTLNSRPDTVRFSWYTSGRSIKKITATQCLELLSRFDQGKPHIQKQLALLQALSDSDSLAQIQEQKPLIRANFAWQQSDGTWQRSARNCPLPILIPLQPNESLPKVTPPSSETPKRNRSVRSDRIIEETPFLPSIRVHRYIH